MSAGARPTYLPPELLDLRVQYYEEVIKGMLEAIGEDPAREGIRKTPERVCESMQFLTKGYAETVEGVVGDALFHEDHHGMVITSCDVFSMCEHHLLPFFGKVHVAYIPRDKIVGLSKIARVHPALLKDLANGRNRCQRGKSRIAGQSRAL